MEMKVNHMLLYTENCKFFICIKQVKTGSALVPKNVTIKHMYSNKMYMYMHTGYNTHSLNLWCIVKGPVDDKDGGQLAMYSVYMYIMYLVFNMYMYM